MNQKMAFMCLSICSIIAYAHEVTTTTHKNNHLENLTWAYETTAGSQIIFDLDQWSRIGSLAAAFSLAKYFLHDVDEDGYEGEKAWYWFTIYTLAFKASINIAMATKEFYRKEIARGIEHLSMQCVPFASWYLLVGRRSSRDRKIASRLITATGFTVIPTIASYYTTEPLLFIRDCLRGNLPIRYVKSSTDSSTHSNA